MAGKTIPKGKSPKQLLRRDDTQLVEGEAFEDALRKWQKVTAPVTEATRRAQIITADDLAIMVY